jgi:hypothetical protein
MQKRPVGITILAVLYIIGGVGIFAVQLFMGGAISQVFDLFGISSMLAVVAILFLGGSALAAGVGMLLGKKWAWWLGAFYLMYAVARNINAIIMIPTLLEQFGTPEAGVAKYYIKHGGRIIIHSLLVLYFFKSNVEAYFQVENVNAWMRVFKLIGATVTIMGAAIVSSILSRGG